MHASNFVKIMKYLVIFERASVIYTYMQIDRKFAHRNIKKKQCHKQKLKLTILLYKGRFDLQLSLPDNVWKEWAVQVKLAWGIDCVLTSIL